MNVPASAPASANSIVVQHRVKPHKGHSDDDHYTVPPMSIVFTHAESGSSHDGIRNVAAHQDCMPTDPGGADHLAKGKFRGVSIGGINGKEARRFRNADRFTVIVRGEATIMVPYNDTVGIAIGQFVRVKKGTGVFRGFDRVQTASIEGMAGFVPGETIGKLIRKSTPRHKENIATVLLL